MDASKIGGFFARLFSLSLFLCIPVGMVCMITVEVYQSRQAKKFGMAVAVMHVRAGKAKAHSEAAAWPLIKAREDSAKQAYQIYLDSVNREEKIYMDSVARYTLVALDDDSTYHTNLQCFSIEWAGHLRTTSLHQAERMGKKMCPKCEEIEEVYSDYAAGDLIPIDDADEYATNNE